MKLKASWKVVTDEFLGVREDNKTARILWLTEDSKVGDLVRVGNLSDGRIGLVTAVNPESRYAVVLVDGVLMNASYFTTEEAIVSQLSEQMQQEIDKAIMDHVLYGFVDPETLGEDDE